MTLSKPGCLNAKLNDFFFFFFLVGWFNLGFFVWFVSLCFTLFRSSGSCLVRALTKYS